MTEKVGSYTVIIPYYRNPGMLEEQLKHIANYPEAVHVIIVDDCSPEPAAPIVDMFGLKQVKLYRVLKDVPWNRGMCRNLGAMEAKTDYIVHVDIDHVLKHGNAQVLCFSEVDPKRVYRFRRFRVGAADATRRKDKIPEGAKEGEIHPHVDSYLIRRDLYFKAGGYNEKFSGYLGGGSEFLRRLEKVAKIVVFPDLCLHCYTRDAVPDANDLHCSRDTSGGKKLWRRLQAKGQLKPKPEELLHLPWERQR